MPGFVIEYHRRTGEMSLTEYAGIREATKERRRRDRLRANTDVEIVSVGAPDLETLRRSHSRYFMRSEQFA